MMPKHRQYRKRHTTMYMQVFGGRSSALLLDWLQSLRWPKQSDDQSSGISWFELAVNFMVTTQTNIPVSVKQRDGTKRYVSTDDDPAFDISTFTMVDVTNSFQGSWKHLRFLLQRLLFPEDQTVKARSLHQLGAGCFRMGLPRRPQLVQQQATMEIIQKYLHVYCHGGTVVFHAIPEVPQMAPVFSAVFSAPFGWYTRVEDEEIQSPETWSTS